MSGYYRPETWRDAGASLRTTHDAHVNSSQTRINFYTLFGFLRIRFAQVSGTRALLRCAIHDSSGLQNKYDFFKNKRRTHLQDNFTKNSYRTATNLKLTQTKSANPYNVAIHDFSGLQNKCDFFKIKNEHMCKIILQETQNGLPPILN